MFAAIIVRSRSSVFAKVFLLNNPSFGNDEQLHTMTGELSHASPPTLYKAVLSIASGVPVSRLAAFISWVEPCGHGYKLGA